MKKPLFIIVSILISFFSKAQHWDSVGAGIDDTDSYVLALQVYNNTLCAAGRFHKAGRIRAYYVASWNGVKWDSLGPGVNGVDAAYALDTFQNKLFIGGDLSIGGTYFVAQWNGSNWDSVSTGMDGRVFSFANFDSVLYAGGQYSIAGGNSASSIAQWNGTSWDSLRNTLPYGGWVDALAVYKGNLIMNGVADTLYKWNGSVLTVFTAMNGYCNTLYVSNGNLYVGGVFTSINGVPANNIAMWNGSVWTALGSGIQGTVEAICSYNGNLYVGGGFNSAGNMPAKDITKWNGSSWLPVGMGTNYEVRALATYQGSLYVGGLFDSAGGLPAMYVARWTDAVILGANETPEQATITNVYPNPNNGIFKISLNTISEKSNVEIYNSLGQKVYSSPFIPDSYRDHNSSFIIDISGQPAGIYLYRIITEGGDLIGEGKVVVEK